MNERLRNRWLFSLLFALLLPVACTKAVTNPPAAPADTGKMETTTIRAVAVMKPTAGNQASGTVTFETVNGKVRVTADLKGLPPGLHGFHIHEFGDCSSPDGTSAGGHFNPTGAMHGAPDNPVGKRHVGDLGNIEADASGKAHYVRVDQMLSLQGADSIIGKGVIVHAQADDLTSQPTGAAGARIACGVIQSEGETE